ncbi:MAG: 4Fe-4S binding protein [Bacteroidetes bacterium]|nr:4Fe-4S binding protein [Bacteroidota bacterium]
MTTVQIHIPDEIQRRYRSDHPLRRTGLALFGIGLLIFVVGATGIFSTIPLLYSLLSLGLATTGALLFIIPGITERKPGIDNDGIMFRPMLNRKSVAWLTAIVFTGFYVLLYWFPSSLEHMVVASDPLSWALRGKAADRWFLYGTLYTLAVLVMGARMLIKYRHSRYHIIRTLSVMFFQLVFAMLLPSILQLFNQPEFYFHYFWPLKYDYLFPSKITFLLENSTRLAVFMGFWAIVMAFIATPILTYFYGKRWYCSWVCGCGALAETLGDPWRQLSDKSLSAWRIERWMIHSVLVFITVVTLLLWINSATEGAVLGSFSYSFSRIYGFLIGAMFAGVIGVGFYPLMGSRVWCRFGCPQAAILGLIQRFASRFRITTNGGQCISCGNCSTYCEMGIDVRWYAQRGQDIIRASCVGCGVCSSVCPRGVLNLENGPVSERLH